MILQQDIACIARAVAGNRAAKRERITTASSSETTTTGDGLSQDSDGVLTIRLNCWISNSPIDRSSIRCTDLVGSQSRISTNIANPASTTSDTLQHQSW